LAGIAHGQARDWNDPLEPFRIIGNVYYVGAKDLTSYLITTPQGDILIDGGLPETASQIERNITTLGFKLKDVKILLNSHAHYDHAGGLAELKRKTGAKFEASERDKPGLEAGASSEFTGVAARYPAVAVDRAIKDGDTVSLGGVTLTAHVTPGHTKGSTTWTMPVEDDGETHHIVFFCSTSVPGYKLVPKPVYPGQIEDYRSSFQKLKTIDADVFLAAHGSFFDLLGKRERLGKGGSNPYIVPGEFQRFVANSEHQFVSELKRQETANR
jgi:metallo-beta-lactamase class B